MRCVAMGLVAMLAAGCAAPANQLFDLSPRGLETVPADGPASVRVEATSVTFVATFAGMWADLLVFDIEVVFVYPWAVATNQMSFFWFVEMAIFMLILVGALAYAWRKNLLEWV